ncbi:MAG TPA: hypothetical protein VGC57_06320 [Cellulomonas sp.]
MTDEHGIDLPELTRAVGDAYSVRRVFGEPYERDGTLVVPVAKVVGFHGLAGARGGGRFGHPGAPGERPGGPDGPHGPGEDDEAEQHAGPGAVGAETAADPGAAAGAGAAEGGSDGPEHGPGSGGTPPWSMRGPGHPRHPFGHGPGAWHAWGNAPGRAHGRGRADAGAAGARTKPLGVYVVDDLGVHWRPALDLNRVILGGQAVGMVAVVALALAIRSRRH